MAHEVFISHATEDADIARQLCSTLEQSGIRCWIAPRDIRPGSDWGASIVAGIRASRAVVLIFSDSANRSRHIPRELTHAIGADIEIVPFRIENVPATGGLDYSLSGVQWFDATVPPMDAHIETLAALLRRTVLAAPTTVPATSVPTSSPHPPPAPAPREVPPVSSAHRVEASPVIAIPPSFASKPAIDEAVPGSAPTLMLAMGLVSVALAAVIAVALLFFSEIPVRLGFDPTGVFATDLSLPAALFPSGLDASKFVDDLLGRLAASPGVSSVGAVDVVPTREDVNGSNVSATRHVSGDYFQTIGIPFIRGRSFDASDAGPSDVTVLTLPPLPVILSESLASRAGASEPIGRTLSDVLATPLDEAIASAIVVGVVRDIPYQEKGFNNPRLVYVPEARVPVRQVTILVKSRLPRTAVETLFENELRALNRGLAFSGVNPLDTSQMSRPRFGSTVRTSLETVAMLLAFAGVVVVTSWFRRRVN